MKQRLVVDAKSEFVVVAIPLRETLRDTLLYYYNPMILGLFVIYASLMLSVLHAVYVHLFFRSQFVVRPPCSDDAGPRFVVFFCQALIRIVYVWKRW